MRWTLEEKKEEDLQQVLNKVLEVGIDEVGKGAVFGPVFSAVVVLTEENKTIFFWIPFHGLNVKGPSTNISEGFSFNLFKALIIESSVATLIPSLSISLTEDCPMP